ncbi:hypothetical protein ElyMa_003612200 [Elysia marginata]|uniref:Uncharacterized protein n=1 Tax=Elysia marginata TaxID=1093978 RepID=A0AAV4ESM5_9GAST|nr:hypothetical protein ElyMa_003612200 [Elysia marginata]
MIPAFRRLGVALQRQPRGPALKLGRRRISGDCRDPCSRERFKGIPAHEEEPISKSQIWKYLSIAGASVVFSQWFYLTFLAHTHPERDEFVAYPHLRLRAKVSQSKNIRARGGRGGESKHPDIYSCLRAPYVALIFR